MKEIAYFDLEIDPQNDSLLDIGCIKSGGEIFHKRSIREFRSFIAGSKYLCGHNIFQHDLKYLQESADEPEFGLDRSIDTLILSTLLFPKNPHHRLIKDDKLQSEERNNPVNDAIKARELLMDQIKAFSDLSDEYKRVLFGLLHNEKEFSSFFRFIGYSAPDASEKPDGQIRDLFKGKICERADLSALMQDPIPLAYALSLIADNDMPPAWVLRNYPRVQGINIILRSTPCSAGCSYCRTTFDPLSGLNHFFGLTGFRKFGDIPLQENAVRAAIQHQSLLAIFPTGGGKSITFQLPALINGENTKSLTVIISPLQSLMKDQVDGLREKHHNTNAVAINGLLNDIERSRAILQVEEGKAHLLYLAPESLRSVSIVQLLLKREISRFVIDEAHCFSAWGHDFRVDYSYIGDFIKSLQEKKQLSTSIPVSCFTATAKQKVIEDICQYFKDKLNLELKLFKADTRRTNLHYNVREQKNEDEKYTYLRMLIEAKPCPVIVYVSRTKKADQLARKLAEDGFFALSFHGKMDKDQKTANQNDFMEGRVDIMVATSAFGMGIDKADVGMVVHYDISDSLENYIQEAGRAGRSESISADCHILFDEEDLNRHFVRHNQTKLTIKEIKQVWKALKDLMQTRDFVSCSPLEIARKAGWDESVRDIETRVSTAIATLEQAKYVKRGHNYPRVYANSILSKNADEAIDQINKSNAFPAADQKENAIRIIKRLFSSKSKRLSTNEEAESRVDYLADQLGLSTDKVIRIVTLLKEQKILADTKDIKVFIKKSEKGSQSEILVGYMKLEQGLFEVITEEESLYYLKELNQILQNKNIPDCSLKKMRTIVNFWATRTWVDRRNMDHSGNHVTLKLTIAREEFQAKMEKRHYLAQFALRYLFRIVDGESSPSPYESHQIEFSVLELKAQAEKGEGIFDGKFSIDEIEDALFYLSRIEALRIEGGFMVMYRRFSISRLEKSNSKQFTLADYKQMEKHYIHKVQQIHIVGEYARKMVKSEIEAARFADDYFNLDFAAFLKNYFPDDRQTEIGRTLTPEKYNAFFKGLSTSQLKIVHDFSSRIIIVAAGPGSGKTKILVHKLASLLLFEDIKPEQLLMLTFSRAAATEFKARLLALIRETAHYVEIKTFHSFCFDLMGKIGNIDESDGAIKDAALKIRNNEIEKSRITKTVLVIDEAQDMDEAQFELVQVLMEQNEGMQLILVGDDDQNIFAFRGSSPAYMKHFAGMKDAVTYTLTENFRSGPSIVSFTNQWASHISQRLKAIPGVSVNPQGSKVSVTSYNTNHLIIPVSETVSKARLTGTTGILVRTNEEAVQLIAVFRQLGVRAQLIQANEKFNLINLHELRAFTRLLIKDEKVPRIGEKEWEGAVRKFSIDSQESIHLKLVLTIIRQFEAIQPKNKYHSDWDAFIRESQMEDFTNFEESFIYVSTIHKAKGKQFDNVFVLLNGFDPSKDDQKRLLYVAFTRPKNRLDIHYNGDYLQSFTPKDVDYYRDEETYSEPTQLAFILTHRDVILGNFRKVQDYIDDLQSGDSLSICEDKLTDSNGRDIVYFSGRFIGILHARQQQGYRPFRARVNFILYWSDKKDGVECKIVLPEITLVKTLPI